MLELREIIVEAIHGQHRAERILVTQCSKIAEAYLRTKAKKHDHLIQFFSSYPDFALDAIAELFQRKSNRLVVFEKWVDRIDFEELTDSELFIQFRRLVFSSVNDHIFSSYGKMDASLAKIIRNIKRVVSEEEVDGLRIDSNTQSIVVVGTNDICLEMNPELLEIKLSHRLPKTSNTLEILEQVRLALETAEADSPSIRIGITTLASIIRRLFTRMQEFETQDVSVSHPFIKDEEWEAFIVKAVERTKMDFYTSYVVSNKISASMFNAYFYIISQILQADYITQISSKPSFYDHFQRVLPDINKEEYRNTHRVIVEYFVKNCRKELQRLIKKEIHSANNVS